MPHSHHSLYLHFPYCRSRCTYCDFNAHLAPNTQASSNYIEALILDLQNYPPDHDISSVYFGGGTPTVTSAQDMQKLLKALEEIVQLTPSYEWTSEANPGTISLELLETLRQGGVNRLSFGVQAFQPHILQGLTRDHTPGEIQQGYQLARQAGFDNISLDLIFGLPQQTLQDWEQSLYLALELKPQHLSIYELVLEPHTPLFHQVDSGTVVLPDEEDVTAMEHSTQSLLSSSGYDRYEISSWSLPGYACQHNLHYWQNKPYYAYGCGATSYLNGWRTNRLKHPKYYQQALARGQFPLQNSERVGLEQSWRDEVSLGLRTQQGVELARIENNYGTIGLKALLHFWEQLPSEWKKKNVSSHLSLSEKGLDWHSSIYIQLTDYAPWAPSIGSQGA